MSFSSGPIRKVERSRAIVRNPALFLVDTRYTRYPIIHVGIESRPIGVHAIPQPVPGTPPNPRGLGQEAFARSLSAAKVEMKPHQVDAALFALWSPLAKGAILADEAGLGKTTEAASSSLNGGRSAAAASC